MLVGQKRFAGREKKCPELLQTGHEMPLRISASPLFIVGYGLPVFLREVFLIQGEPTKKARDASDTG